MRLGLGTVQFGQPYGISNTHGQPSEKEITRILTRAAEAGIQVLDTASEYGASEELLGKCMPSAARFRIVTKTPSFAGNITEESTKRLITGLETSLRKLKMASVYALLVHQVNDLLHPNGGLLWETMNRLKLNGLVEKIGASVYTPEQAEILLARYPLEILQFPLNVFDRRFASTGLIKRLKERHIEVHARSIFLQGVVLMDPKSLPTFLNPLKAPLTQYRLLLRQNELSALQGALLRVAGDELDCALVGVARLEELNDILHAMETLPKHPVDWSTIPEAPVEAVDPSRWPAGSRS